MTRIPKVLLAVSLTAFAVGGVVAFGNPEIPVGWTVAMPVGAIFFGLFLVTFLLQQEVARFDEEERARLELAERYAARTAKDAGAQIPLVQIYSATRPTPHSECGHLPLKTLSRIARRVREVTGLKAEVF